MEITEAQHREYLSFLALQLSPTDITSKLAKMEKDNQKQRDEIRERDEKLKAVPAEGSKVLTADEAKEWEAVQALALKPADIKKAVEERDALKTKVATRERDDGLAKAVATEEWMPESTKVLARLLGETPFETKDEEVEVTRGGVKVKEKQTVGYVIEGGKHVRLSEWAKANDLPETMFAAKGGTGEPTLPTQRGGGGDSKPAVTGGVDDAIKRNHEAAMKPNPLRPAKA